MRFAAILNFEIVPKITAIGDLFFFSKLEIIKSYVFIAVAGVTRFFEGRYLRF